MTRLCFCLLIGIVCWSSPSSAGGDTHISGPTAWATYDYVFQAIRNGELNAQERGKCTSILRKESPGWLIRHEHCSKTKPQGMER